MSKSLFPLCSHTEILTQVKNKAIFQELSQKYLARVSDVRNFASSNRNKGCYEAKTSNAARVLN